MFQKLGLKDILTELWYRKFIIVGIAVLAVVCSFVNVFAINREEKTTDSNEVDMVYTKTVLVNIEAKEISPYYDIMSQSQKLRNSYLTTCRTEYFAQYLQDNFSEDEMLGEYLIAKKEKSTVEIPDENIKAIMDAVSFEASSDSSTIKFSFKCNDSDIGDKIIDLFIPYMKSAEDKLGDTNFVEVARSSFVEKVSLMQTVNSTNKTNALIKNFILYTIGFEFIYLLIVLLIVVLVPKVHSVNDLKNYFDAPIWEHK